MTPVQAVAVCAAGIRRHARRIAATIITLGFFAALALAVLLGWATVFEGCLVVFVVLVVGWLLWLTFELFGLHERTDDNTDGVDRALSDAHAARDEADQALGGVQAVHDHLAGSEPAGTGRHAAQKTTEYRRDKTLSMPVVETATPSRPGRATQAGRGH